LFAPDVQPEHAGGGKEEIPGHLLMMFQRLDFIVTFWIISDV